MSDGARCHYALRKLAEYAEKSYWQNRNFIDASVPDWVRGDDGPSYPFLLISVKLKSLADELERKPYPDPPGVPHGCIDTKPGFDE